jgi:hypothetical protein
MLKLFATVLAFHNEARTEIAKILAMTPSEIPTGIL